MVILFPIRRTKSPQDNDLMKVAMTVRNFEPCLLSPCHQTRILRYTDATVISYGYMIVWKKSIEVLASPIAFRKVVRKEVKISCTGYLIPPLPEKAVLGNFEWEFINRYTN